MFEKEMVLSIIIFVRNMQIDSVQFHWISNLFMVLPEKTHISLCYICHLPFQWIYLRNDYQKYMMHLSKENRTLLFKIQHTVTVDIDVSFLYYAMNKLIAIPDNWGSEKRTSAASKKRLSYADIEHNTSTKSFFNFTSLWCKT